MKHLILTLTFAILAISKEGSSKDVLEREENKTTNDILNEYRDCVSHSNQGKIYLKPEKIFSDGDSLYLQNESDALRVPYLFFDAVGYYLFAPPMEEKEATYQCSNPFCKYEWNVARGNFCPRCQSPGVYIGVKD